MPIPYNSGCDAAKLADMAYNTQNATTPIPITPSFSSICNSWKLSIRRPAHSPQAQSRYKRLAGLLTCLALRCLPKVNASVTIWCRRALWDSQQRELSGIFTRFPFNLCWAVCPREPMLVQRYKKSWYAAHFAPTFFWETGILYINSKAVCRKESSTKRQTDERTKR